MKEKIKIFGIIILGLLFYLRVEFFLNRIDHFNKIQLSNTKENIAPLRELNGLSKRIQEVLDLNAAKSIETSLIIEDEIELFKRNIIVMIIILTTAGILCSFPQRKSNKGEM